MTNYERIEAFFNNEFTEAEQQQLHQDMESDASLKADFQHQKEVVNGIKAYRKAELIARLDNIQIITSGQSLLLKTLGIIGVASIFAVSTYIWINMSEEQPTKNELVVETEQIAIPQVKKQELIIANNDANEMPKEEISNDRTEIKGIEKEETTTAKVDQVIPDIIIPDVQEPESGASVKVDEELSAPESMALATIQLSTSTDVEVKLSKKYNFHYQVNDGGLTLYGNFNDSPFEVIELKTNKGINSYLYFKDHFYSLLINSSEIQPLVALKDKQLIEELQKRR